MSGTLRAKVNGVWTDIGLGGGAGAADPGDVKATAAAVAPTGWLMFGQTYTGADAAYPDLWAVAPAAWKVGSDLVLPDATDATLLGGGTVGTVAGTNSKTIAAANMPAHTHSRVAHTHTINHDHASVSPTAVPATRGSHLHDLNQDSTLDGLGGTIVRGVATQYTGNGPMAQANGHTHTATISINIPAITATSGASSAANSGNAGSGTAISTLRKHLRVNWIVKT